MKREPRFSKSRVILAGGSYSGTMVAWFRQKYPHLAVGAWASSAPLFAKVDFKEYKEVVASSILRIGGQKCLDKVAEGFRVTERLVLNGEFERLRKLYNLCYDFDGTNDYNRWSFLSALADTFSGIVQGHTDRTIERACDVILRKGLSHTGREDELQGFSEFIKSQMFTYGCLHLNYKDQLPGLLNTKWNNNSLWRQWFYQTCSEFGWYHTSASSEQPFGSGFPIELYLRICNDVYGNGFTNATLHNFVERKNTLYGALNPEVTNVIFTHGSLDPWHKMGVLKSVNDRSPVIIIPDVSHTPDFGSINLEKDSKEMVYAKITIRNFVKNWLEL